MTTMHNGMHAFVFKSKEYYGIMADKCKYTVVGQIFKVRPQIDVIQAKFAEKIPLKTKVKIEVYNLYHIFIDFECDTDYHSVYYKMKMVDIAGPMKLLK